MPVKIKPIEKRKSSEQQQPAKRQKVDSDKDNKDASSPAPKTESPRKHEKSVINLNAPVSKAPNDAYINKRALRLFRDVNVAVLRWLKLIEELE